jgi:ergothioneine biosynthesis protein EgtB
VIAELDEARALTLAFVSELDDEALRAQPDPAFSPIGWHLGHVAFTEALWILQRCSGESALVTPYARAWAQNGTPKDKRSRQPPKAELLAYLAEVRARVLEKLPALEGNDPLLAGGFVGWMIASHEHQHLETMKVVRQLEVEHRVGLVPPPLAKATEPTSARIELAGGAVTIGTDARLAYDNEKPAHEARLEPFAIDRAPATVAEWDTFRAEGGYARPELWSAEGWAWRERERAQWPRGWTCDEEDRLAQVRLDGTLAALSPSEAVTGVSAHEADAFARWRGARLPTELEWEHAAPQLEGIGSAWEWTASVFCPYPGFRAFPYRRYSEPYFDGAHRVLRGGSPFTHPRIARRTFRNWYEPGTRQIVAGVRCAW